MKFTQIHIEIELTFFLDTMLGVCSWGRGGCRVSVLALHRPLECLNRSFDPEKFDKHGIKGSIIALTTIAHHIHLSKFVKILIFLTP